MRNVFFLFLENISIEKWVDVCDPFLSFPPHLIVLNKVILVNSEHRDKKKKKKGDSIRVFSKYFVNM